LIPYLKGNVGLVFTNGDIGHTKNILSSIKVSSHAKVGMIAPQDVTIKKGSTGLNPDKTPFFQVLHIATKIVKSQIEILQDVKLIKAGTKIGCSEATLLKMLNLKPFYYVLSCDFIYEGGRVYPVKKSEIDNQTLVKNLDPVAKIDEGNDKSDDIKGNEDSNEFNFSFFDDEDNEKKKDVKHKGDESDEYNFSLFDDDENEKKENTKVKNKGDKSDDSNEFNFNLFDEDNEIKNEKQMDDEKKDNESDDSVGAMFNIFEF